jgi:hypothetical protein
MALLDGQQVADSEIDPAKHRFVGSFRAPYRLPETAGYIYCPCGTILQNQQQSREHWQAGHWDQPQYQTI